MSANTICWRRPAHDARQARCTLSVRRDQGRSTEIHDALGDQEDHVVSSLRTGQLSLGRKSGETDVQAARRS